MSILLSYLINNCERIMAFSVSVSEFFLYYMYFAAAINDI